MGLFKGSGTNLGRDIRLQDYVSFKPVGTVNCIIPVGGSGDWDYNMREIGNVLFCPWEPTKKYMAVYSGFANTYSENNVYVGLATSNDGITWTKEGKIIDSSLEDPYLVYHGGKYYLFAEDKEMVPFRGIRRYSSTDLATWVNDGLVLDRGVSGSWDAADVSSPTVIIENGTWKMLYEGRSATQDGSVGLATSNDGLSWVKHDSNPVIIGNKPTVFSREPNIEWATNIVPDDILKVNGVYYLIVHGYPHKGNFVPILLTSDDLITWRDCYGKPMELPRGETVTDGTIMFAYDGELKIHYNSYVTSARGINQFQIRGILPRYEGIADEKIVSGIKIIDNEIAAAGDFIATGYIDVEDCVEIIITARWDASITQNGVIWWSNDKVVAHGIDVFYATDKTTDVLSPPPVVTVKAKYVRIGFQNRSEEAYAVTAYLRKVK